MPLKIIFVIIFYLVILNTNRLNTDNFTTYWQNVSVLASQSGVVPSKDVITLGMTNTWLKINSILFESNIGTLFDSQQSNTSWEGIPSILDCPTNTDPWDIKGVMERERVNFESNAIGSGDESKNMDESNTIGSGDEPQNMDESNAIGSGDESQNMDEIIAIGSGDEPQNMDEIIAINQQ
ncbi:hypothetical protein RFI_04861 [Reticulomyxa filosa]|uniref:Uncharacterized protein n=1 Tax=Reticulomyxa filosa TaxID=46433 RepID=X6P206_RETFI|nr:hypothetical protein RFI_04861 [Reticulomyxa filosa]|eukprot:ETO32256.1 hypothetical protein RFI_04861 [Reticulomyxa filosa]